MAQALTLSNCCNTCPTDITANVPGATGAAGAAGTPGADGTDGINAFTVTTEDFVMPAVGASVVVTVEENQWAAVGQTVFVYGAGGMEVTVVPVGVTTSMTLKNLGWITNASPAAVIGSGAKVTPNGPNSPTGLIGTNYLVDSLYDGTAVPAEGAALVVTGYSTENDGGQGVFWWDEVSVAADDGGVSIVEPTGWVGPGRWRRVEIGEPRPEWGAGFADAVMTPSTVTINGEDHIKYSVTGTDCRDAINACFTAYGRCRLYKGVYAISRWVGQVDAVDPVTLRLSGSGKVGGHSDGDGTTLALLDAATAHGNLFAWGTFYPDVMFGCGNYASNCVAEGIHFYANAWNRTVTGKAGYTKAATEFIKWVGSGGRVTDCAFSGMGAASGSTGGSRTTGIPETFLVNLGPIRLESAYDWSDEWISEPGPMVSRNDWFGPIAPQVDPDDFGSTAGPEITALLIAGVASAPKHGTGSIDIGTTALSSTADYFESWMEGRWMYVGTERFVIDTVLTATTATTTLAAAATHTDETLRTTKLIRRWFDTPIVRDNTFSKLQIYRASDTNKQIRSIHLVTFTDVRDRVLQGNVAVACDGPLEYADNGVLYGGDVSMNVVDRCFSAFTYYMQHYALAADETTGAARGWWADWSIHDNDMKVGFDSFDRCSTTYIDAASTILFTTAVGGTPFVLTIDADNPTQALLDSFFPETTLVHAQSHAMERVMILYNKVIGYGAYAGIFESTIFNSTYSATASPELIGNIFDQWVWSIPLGRWNGVPSEDLAKSFYNSLQLYWGRNESNDGEVIPLYITDEAKYLWPIKDTSQPLGWTYDSNIEITWATDSVDFTDVVPDGGGYIWYASTRAAKTANTVPSRSLRLTWAGDGTYAVKLVLPVPASHAQTFDLGEVVAGHIFEVVNASSVAADITLYYDDGVNPVLLGTVKSGSNARVVVLPGSPPTMAILQTPDQRIEYEEIAVSASDIDWSLGRVFTKTLPAGPGTTTFTFSNVVPGKAIQVILEQDATTARDVDWSDVDRWPGGTEIEMSATLGSIAVYSFVNRSGTIIGTVVNDCT